MAKKGQVQLQTEINTDDEWDACMEKPGLTVVDIYSEWSGPCSSMQANLKKLKFDYGELLQLAIAKSDTVSYLERFRGSCEPTWMFVVEGQVVNLMFGADSPRLMAMIVDELQKEGEVREGARERQAMAVTDLSPEEQDRFNAVKAIEDEKKRIAIEKATQQLYERRLQVANAVLENLPISGVVLIWPHAAPNVKATLEEYWETTTLALQSQERHCITEEMLEEMLYFSGQTFTDLDIEKLCDGTSVAYHLKSRDSEALGPDGIDDAILEFIYGESKEPPGSPDSPAEKLLDHVPVPKEAPPPSATTLEGQEESLGAIPSMPSMILTQSQATVKSEKSQVSMRSGDRSRAAMASTDLDQDELHSKTKISKSKISKAVVISEVSVKEIEEEEEETVEVTGLWVPPNALTRATALKVLFRKLYEPFAIPEPVPTPPHIAIAFEAYRRKELRSLMELYKDDIMRVGVFTSAFPAKVELVAKSIPKFDKLIVKKPIEGEKLVLQLSRKRSEPWCVFAQQSPIFMSNTVEDGEEHCKLFFPEGYDEPDEEEEDEEKKKEKKKTEEQVEVAEVESQAEAKAENEEGGGETEEPPPE